MTNVVDLFKTKSIVINYQWRIQDFPQGGAPTPKSAIIFQIFCQKPHENERIWTPGGRVPGAPLDPPMHTTMRWTPLLFFMITNLALNALYISG